MVRREKESNDEVYFYSDGKGPDWLDSVFVEPKGKWICIELQGAQNPLETSKIKHKKEEIEGYRDLLMHAGIKDKPFEREEDPDEIDENECVVIDVKPGQIKKVSDVLRRSDIPNDVIMGVEQELNQMHGTDRNAGN